MNHETATHAAMAQQQAIYEGPEEFDDPELSPGYTRYLADFAQQRSDDYQDFLVDVQEGRTDPMTYEDWAKEEEAPQTFEEWGEDEMEAAQERAMYERHPEGW